MPKSENQKIKLLRLLEILKTNTDEENPMSTNELISRLASEGVKTGRKALYDDIRLLNEYGYEIQCTRSNQNMYYVVDRTFDVAELKILLDAVQAASFITEKKTRELVCKIANLAGSHRADLMLENIVCFDTTKHTNEKIYYSIDALDRAIIEKKKASFLYFDYAIDGSKLYRKNGMRYTVSPIALVFSDNNYYLTCYTDKHKNLSNYRVDRMDCVEISNETITKSTFDSKDKSRAFNMFLGETRRVTLSLDKSLVDVVIDKFGETTHRTPLNDSTFQITVNVQISPTFFAWCSSFGNRLKIIAPLDVRQDYILALKSTLSAYDS